jgi:hypothetical protein
MEAVNDLLGDRLFVSLFGGVFLIVGLLAGAGVLYATATRGRQVGRGTLVIAVGAIVASIAFGAWMIALA